MKFFDTIGIRVLVLSLVGTLFSCSRKEETTSEKEKEIKTEGEHRSVSVRAGIDHSVWDRLVGRYVDEKGLIAYERWKASSTDLEDLRQYLAEFGAKPEPPAQGTDLGASLVNAYNAFTVSWVLEKFPTESIRSLKDSFTGRRHLVGGEKVSLDDIEHGTLRPRFGYRIHAVVSCASLSCPPLAGDAYSASGFGGELDAAMRRWLGREDLNRFLPEEKKVEISEVFQWYLEDFQKAGGLKGVLARHAPERYQNFLASGDFEIEYRTYDWGLNDQGGKGKDYSTLQLWKDKVKEKL